MTYHHTLAASTLGQFDKIRRHFFLRRGGIVLVGRNLGRLLLKERLKVSRDRGGSGKIRNKGAVADFPRLMQVAEDFKGDLGLSKGLWIAALVGVLLQNESKVRLFDEFELVVERVAVDERLFFDSESLETVEDGVFRHGVQEDRSVVNYERRLKRPLLANAQADL